VVVATPEGATELGETRLAALPNAVVASLPIDAGIALIRVFLPDRASMPAASAALAAADCNAAI
jgi:uncharacterized membrane protein